MGSKTQSLAAAMLDAQRAIRGVLKESKNDFHRYKYTSAEHMILAARDALHVAGLTASRESWSLLSVDGFGLAVVSRMRVDHSDSGENREYETTFPVVPEKGRPVDKAVATALSTSYGYWLRDLLLIPRVDSETELKHSDMDTRDDSEHTPAPAKGRKRKPAKAKRTRQDWINLGAEYAAKFKAAKTSTELAELEKQCIAEGFPDDIGERLQAAYIESFDRIAEAEYAAAQGTLGGVA